MERNHSSSRKSISYHNKNDERAPKIPLRPLLAFQAAEKPTKLCETVLEIAKYPPLMQPKSWTRAVPYKVQFPLQLLVAAY